MAKIKLDKLKKEFENTYKNPALKELKRLEKERQSILDSVAGLPMPKSAVTDLQNTLTSGAFQSAFKTVDDYKQYSNPLLEDIAKKDYQALQRELEKTYKPYLKKDISLALESLSSAKDTFDKLTTGSSLRGLEEYGNDISMAMRSIAENKELLDPAKKLTSSLKSLESNIFADKMGSLNERRLDLHRIHEPIKIPKNPMMEQNEKIIGQLDIQNEALTSIGTYISSQNEKLDRQNKIVEEEIKDNKESAKKAFWTAIASIFIAILATFGSIWVSYDVYNKEDTSNNLQYKELLQSISKNDKSDLTIKQTKVLNKILKAMEQQNNNSVKLHKKIDSIMENK